MKRDMDHRHTQLKRPRHIRMRAGETWEEACRRDRAKRAAYRDAAIMREHTLKYPALSRVDRNFARAWHGLTLGDLVEFGP